MVELCECHMNARKSFIKSFDNFIEAEDYVRAYYKVAHFEVDVDHKDCADFITATGGLYTIEPLKVRVDA